MGSADTEGLDKHIPEVSSISHSVENPLKCLQQGHVETHSGIVPACQYEACPRRICSMNSAEGLALGGEENEEIKHASAKPINHDSLDLLNFWCVGEVRRKTFTPDSEDRAK